MLAIVKPSGAPGLAVESRPDPVAGDHDVVVRFLRTGIGGSGLAHHVSVSC